MYEVSEIFPFKRYSILSGLRNSDKNNNMVIMQVSSFFVGFFEKADMIIDIGVDKI